MTGVREMPPWLKSLADDGTGLDPLLALLFGQVVPWNKEHAYLQGSSVLDVPGVPSCAAALVLIVDEDNKVVKEIVSAPDDI